MKRITIWLPIIAIAFTAASSSAAMLLTPSESGYVSDVDYYNTLGFSFQVDSAIIVDGLGVWDKDKAGLLVSTQAGLWDASGNLLAAVQIPAGASAPLDGYFRWSSFSVLTLAPGKYTVGAVCNGLSYTMGFGFTTLPGITFLSSDQSYSGPDLQYPGDHSILGNPGWWGGNVHLAPVPEPTTLVAGALLLLPFGVSTLRILRKKRPA